MNNLLSITDSLGLAVNVRSFGARGDARKVNGDTLTGTTITCPNGCFTEADVGKAIWGTTTGSGAVLARTTIEQVVNATTIIVAASPGYATPGVTFVLGTDDTAAFHAAVAEVESRPLRGSIYIPSGGYITTATPFVFTADPVNGALPSIVGEGASSTVFYPAPDSLMANSNHIFNYDDLGGRKDMRGFSIDGTHCPHSGRTVAFLSSSANYSTMTDVRIINFSWPFAGLHVSGQFATLTRCHIEGMWHGRGIYCNGSVVLVDSYVGNCGYFAVDVTNGGLTVARGVLDECENGTIQLQNSAAKLTQGLVYAGAGLAAIKVDANSTLRAVDSTIVPFDFNNNATGLRIAAASAPAYCGMITGNSVGDDACFILQDGSDMFFGFPADVTFYKNGAAGDETAAGSGPMNAFAVFVMTSATARNYTWMIGDDRNLGTRHWLGDYGEIFADGDEWDAGTVADVTAYLGNKWGIAV